MFVSMLHSLTALLPVLLDSAFSRTVSRWYLQHVGDARGAICDAWARENIAEL